MCLPFLFKLSLQRGNEAGLLRNSLSAIVKNHQHTTKLDTLTEPHVVDFKLLSKARDHAKAQQLTVPFNVQRITASVLCTMEPVNNIAVREKAVVLVFKVDGKVLLKFRPANVEVEMIFVQETHLYEIKLDFKTDLSHGREALQGAKLLEFALEIDETTLVNMDGAPMTLLPAARAKLEQESVHVQFPEDI